MYISIFKSYDILLSFAVVFINKHLHEEKAGKLKLFKRLHIFPVFVCDVVKAVLGHFNRLRQGELQKTSISVGVFYED